MSGADRTTGPGEHMIPGPVIASLGREKAPADSSAGASGVLGK
jgi:hypothetical protein